MPLFRVMHEAVASITSWCAWLNMVTMALLFFVPAVAAA